MDCIISLVTNKGKCVSKQRYDICNETNLMALIYDLRATINNCEGVVRAVVDIALSPPGKGG